MSNVLSVVPTPEQIAAAQAILAASQQATTSSDVQEESTTEQAENAAPTNPITVDQLRIAFGTAMASSIYLDNPKRLERLLEMLKVPMSNEKDFNQFLNHAKKDLLAKAAQTAADTGMPVVLPTMEQIEAEANTRLAAKLQKEQDKAEKKSK